ncbi:rhodanese-like protein [Bacteroides pyogenes F0041]|uniref:Rhodanese-like protein n=1 Tax=Bacteroides pyogenes F0041 TaxID=1321819 RepID=U2CJN0_9BACE|nr:rhodanese-like domain-containing protein [Bacteroides pyogenes]ERI84740.1 rhodanese-like protein [Bacteroides pyogenes F0041]
MYRLNQLLMGLFVFLSSLFGCQKQNVDFKSLNVEDFEAYVQNDAVQLLDVRTPAEYSEDHIAKSININVLDDSFESMAGSLLTQERPVAVYCRSGKRSKRAAKMLLSKGYQVVELAKGFNSWKSAAKPVER